MYGFHTVSNRDEYLAACELLLDAFEDYPLYEYLFVDKMIRRKGIMAVMGVFLERAYVDGSLILNQESNAMAAWLQPTSQSLTVAEKLRLIAGLLRYLPPKQYLSRIRYLLRMEQARLQEPHIYALCAVVQASARGQGLSKALMRHLLQRVRPLKLPLCAETAKQENVLIWQASGFSVYSHFEDAALPQYLLVNRSCSVS